MGGGDHGESEYESADEDIVHSPKALVHDEDDDEEDEDDDEDRADNERDEDAEDEGGEEDEDEGYEGVRIRNEIALFLSRAKYPLLSRVRHGAKIRRTTVIRG